MLYAIAMGQIKRNCFDKNFVSKLHAGFIDRVCVLYEAVAIKEGSWLAYVGKS